MQFVKSPSRRKRISLLLRLVTISFLVLFFLFVCLAATVFVAFIVGFIFSKLCV